MKERDREVRDSYIRQEREIEGMHYLLVPAHKVCVPVGRNDIETILTFLATRGDYALPNERDYYPIVEHRHIAIHFPEYTIVPLIKEKLVTKPISCFSGYEQGILERKRRVRAEQIKEERAAAKLANNPFA